MEKQVFWVDIPQMPRSNDEDPEYANVAEFETREEAIEYAKKMCS